MVTLVTGDRVTVLDGRMVTVTPGDGRHNIQFLKQVTGGRITVIPVDALPLVRTGRVDRKLFDVTGLIRLGYDTRPDIPLIVTYQDGVHELTGARRALPSVGGAAVSASKNGSFWASVNATRKVWLDGQVRLSDEASNTQIGVPTAWQAGLTGKGVTVAVLDSGYDAKHPDLAVADAKDFTDSADGTKDDVGHGTHVSSIIAGSGTASQGRYRGVAPDARLVVGKVCGDETCDESAILAGMEWAAVQQHAKVVNLSLGSDDGSDGADPLSEAVNTLTARTGSLFVIAAGNSGAPGTVGTPGAADAALTVASVGRTDRLSDFSSQGPRVGDYVVKPDIAAPGEDIVAARAAGTSMGTPVDQTYTSASGTSMATPHIAGAAAILAQQHPDWTAAQLKAALMSTAKPVDTTVYGQGAGRVDAARAVTQHVTADGSVSFGLLHWPYTTLPPVTRAVTYHNDGDTPVTLALTSDATAFSLNTTTVTVGAHGTATADLTLHPDKLAAGNSSGRVVATSADTVVQTAYGVTAEPESYDVTVNLIDRNGKPADYHSDLTFTPLFPSGDPDTPQVDNGMVKARLPKGAYGVTGVIITDQSSGTIGSVPTLVVDHPGITVTFDARRANKIQAVVDAPKATRYVSDAMVQYTLKGDDQPRTIAVGGGPDDDMYALPVRGDARGFAFGYQTILTSPDRMYVLAVPFVGAIPTDPRIRVHDSDLHVTDARYHSQGVSEAVGDRVDFPFFLPGQNITSISDVPTTLPSRRLEFHSVGPRWSPHLLQQYLPGHPVKFFEGAIDAPDVVYKRATTRQEWNTAVSGVDMSQADTVNAITRDGDTLTALVSSHSPGETGHSGSAVDDIFVDTGTAVLSRDGKEIGRSTTPSASNFTLPPGTGRYTLAVQANRNRDWAALATQVTTTYTFDAAETGRLRLPTVKVTGDFDGMSRARANSRFTLDLAATTQANAKPAKITTLTVDVSTDDGLTWRPATVHVDRDGHWCAQFTNPASGYVSVRVKAANSAGNTLEQTTIRAYGIA